MTFLRNLQSETARNVLLTHCPKSISVLLSLINLLFVVLFSTVKSMTSSAVSSYKLLILPFCQLYKPSWLISGLILSPSVTLEALPKSNTALNQNSKVNVSTMTKLEVRLKGKQIFSVVWVLIFLKRLIHVCYVCQSSRTCYNALSVYPRDAPRRALR